MKILRKLDLLPRGVGPLAIVHIVTLVCGIAATVVWARLMPQETFGQFKVILSILGVVSAFCLLGTSQAAIMSASKGADGNLVRLLRGKLLANVGGGLAILGAAAYYAWGREESSPIAIGLLVAAFLFPLYNTSDIWMSWLNGKSKFRVLASGRIVTALLTLASITVMGIFGVVDIWIVILLYVLILAIQNFTMLRLALGFRNGNAKNDNILRFGRHATLAMSFGSLLALDMVILEHYHSASDVAIYAVVLLFPDQIKALFSIFNQAFSPKMYGQASLSELWRGFRHQFLVLTACFVAIGVAGFLLLPIITPLLFSDKYAQAAEYGKWLWLAIAAFGSLTFLGTALTTTQKPLFIYAPYVGYPILLGGLYIAWAEDGIAGMVAARVIASVLLALFYFFSFFFYLKSHGERRLPS